METKNDLTKPIYQRVALRNPGKDVFVTIDGMPFIDQVKANKHASTLTSNHIDVLKANKPKAKKVHEPETIEKEQDNNLNN